MSNIIKAITILTAFIKLALECKEKVGEFNLKEDLPTIIDYLKQAVDCLAAANKSTQSNNQEQQQQDNN